MANPSKKPNIRIRLLATYLLAVISLFVVSIVCLYISMQSYEKKLCQESVKALQQASTAMDAELKKIETMSSGIITNLRIQRQLTQLHQSKSQYEQEAFSHAIRQTLNSFLYEIASRGVDCMMLTGVQGTTFREELRINPIQEKELIAVDGLLKALSEKPTLSEWILPSQDAPFLVYAHVVRAVLDAENGKIGVLGVFLKPKALVGRIFGVDNDTREFFHIIDKDGTSLYGGQDNTLLSVWLREPPPQGGYEIIFESGERYLVSQVVSQMTGWKFVQFTRYSDMVKSITPARNILAFTFLAIFIMILILGVTQINTLTLPVERLSLSLQKVGEDILLQGIPNQSMVKKDIGESSFFEREFNKLVDRINRLITSNYEKQIAIREWELRALRAQINPHFLYNTLDTVSWLAATNRQEQIPEIVASLANLLRSSINQNNYTTLERECAMLMSYITIQKVRYKERLSFSMDVDPGLNNCLVPCMILQPLTENSIRHVLEESQETCDIRITTRLYEDYYELIHIDSGDPKFIDAYKSGQLVSHGTGIGLKNIDRRIKKLCGEAYGLVLESLESPQGTKVILSIPYGYDEEDFRYKEGIK